MPTCHALLIALHWLMLTTQPQAEAPLVDGGFQDSLDSPLRDPTVGDAQRVEEQDFFSSCRQAQWALSAKIGWRAHEKRSARNARLRDTKCLVGRCPPMEGKRIVSLKLEKDVISNFESWCCMDDWSVYLTSTRDGVKLNVVWQPISEQDLNRFCR